MLLLELGHELIAEVDLAVLSTLHVNNHIMDQIQQDHKECIRSGGLQLHIEVGNSHFCFNL